MKSACSARRPPSRRRSPGQTGGRPSCERAPDASWQAGLAVRLAEGTRRGRSGGMAPLRLGLLPRRLLTSSRMLLLVWLIVFVVLIKLLPILGPISGKTVKLMVLALTCIG